MTYPRATVETPIHTVEWGDGLEVVRLAKIKNQIVLQITWLGKIHQLRLGKGVACPTKESRAK